MLCRPQLWLYSPHHLLHPRASSATSSRTAGNTTATTPGWRTGSVRPRPPGVTAVVNHCADQPDPSRRPRRHASGIHHRAIRARQPSPLAQSPHRPLGRSRHLPRRHHQTLGIHRRAPGLHGPKPLNATGYAGTRTPTTTLDQFTGSGQNVFCCHDETRSSVRTDLTDGRTVTPFPDAGYVVELREPAADDRLTPEPRKTRMY